MHGEAVAARRSSHPRLRERRPGVANGKFTKIASPTPYGRIGNTRGHEDSPVVLGDMKVDADAEMERPDQFSLIDTTTDQLKLVKMPTGCELLVPFPGARTSGRGAHHGHRRQAASSSIR